MWCSAVLKYVGCIFPYIANIIVISTYENKEKILGLFRIKMNKCFFFVKCRINYVLIFNNNEEVNL